MPYTCQDKYHEDLYENGQLVELRQVDMVGTICVGCHEERDDVAEFDRQNAPDWDTDELGTRWDSQRGVAVGRSGRCEDAPCCGCCTVGE
jgi:hypothetical protein